MKKNLFNLLLLVVALVGLQATAAIPSNYYNGALGKTDQDLMTALHQKIHGHYRIYYNKLWEKFQSTDCVDNIIIDRYSNSQFTYSEDQCGAYSGIGECYNKEHSVPKSWWGGGSEDTDTMYSDLFHIYPVDGWVNAERDNHPFGDCANGTPKGTGKLGRCTHSGYTGTVFEVADEYKGDFARSYFYMVVRYMHLVGDWTQGEGVAVFTNSSYKHLTPWAISQLLEWHRNDPVSELEMNRNEAVYGIQRNRNPFIDHPELAEYLWGNRTGEVWTGNDPTPVLSSPWNGTTIDLGTNTGGGVSKVITVKGANLTMPFTVSVAGLGFSVTPNSLTAEAVNAGTTVTVTYSGGATNATGRLIIRSDEVNSTVTLTATYNPNVGTETIETWEGCTSYSSYSNTFIQGNAFAWNTSNVGIFSGDTHCNDALSCRFGTNSNSYIAMAEDLSDGASKITFYAAKWSNNEATPTLQVQYSTNGGSTWTTVGTCSPNTTWEQYGFELDVTGSVRFKILQTVGARLNIDDIAITSNPGQIVINPVIDIFPIDDMEAEVGGASTVVSTTISGVENGEDINVGATGNFEISLDRTTWSRVLTLDPTGEVIYIRIANTANVGTYEGKLVARTSQVSAYADLHGTVTEKQVKIGDVNMDGKVNISDVTTLITYLLSGSADPFDEVAADVNEDSRISIGDVTSLITMLLTQGSGTASAWAAYPAEGGIRCENNTAEQLEVYDMDGECCAVVRSLGTTFVPLSAGVYVVATNDHSRKVVVK